MMSSSLDSKWNVDRIKKELKKEKETKLALQHAIMELEQVQDKMQHNQENVEENEWYKRYSEQAAINSQLSQQISQLEAQLMNAREVEGDDISFASYQDLDNTNVRQLLKKLEREKIELEWQLKDCEWKLDQEAAAVYKAGEDKKMMMTELGQASMIISGEGGKQKSNKKQHNPAALTGTVVKQKSLTASPQKQVKKSPDKDDTSIDEVQATGEDIPHLATSPVQD